MFECGFQKKFDWSVEILQGELLQETLFELWSKRKFRSLIKKTCSNICFWPFIEFLQRGFRFAYDINERTNQNMFFQWSWCESYFDWFYFMKKSNKMKKEKSLLEIKGVSFEQFNGRMTVEEINNHLVEFRKKNRPSYYLINALLQIRRLQTEKKTREEQIELLRDRLWKTSNQNVLLWIVFILVTILCGVWCWTIVKYLIDLFA